MNRIRPTAQQRQSVSTRARGRCEYCLAPQDFSNAPFAIEHIQPVAQGGRTVLENLAYACLGCNGHKADKVTGLDPQTGATVPLFHPRQQRWEEHFAWADSYSLVVGRTPTGRATVEALCLNRL